MSDRLLARIIHERFYCNRGFAALAREASFLTRRSYLVVRQFGGSDLKRDTLHEERAFGRFRDEPS